MRKNDIGKKYHFGAVSFEKDKNSVISTFLSKRSQKFLGQYHKNCFLVLLRKLFGILAYSEKNQPQVS